MTFLSQTNSKMNIYQFLSHVIFVFCSVPDGRDYLENVWPLPLPLVLFSPETKGEALLKLIFTLYVEQVTLNIVLNLLGNESDRLTSR